MNDSTGSAVIASPAVTTTYCVEVTDDNNCKDTACVIVTIDDPCDQKEEFMVPNAFSPNGDGKNDVFCIQGIYDCIDAFKIIIYDRWGVEVYTSTDQNFCWDGIYDGVVLDAQVFVYYMELYVKDNTIQKSGNSSLIK